VFKDPGEQPYYAGVGDDYYNSNIGGRINSWQLWYSRSSYAYNQDVSKLQYFGGVQRGIPRKGWSKGPQKENQWVTVSTSDAPLVTDTMANSAIWWSWTDFPPNSDFQAYVDYSFRHNGMSTTNVLYWDGHAVPRRRYSQTGQVIWQRLFTHAPDGAPAI
jgi:prepilin-type processing-associated H-X9-DG protein